MLFKDVTPGAWTTSQGRHHTQEWSATRNRLNGGEEEIPIGGDGGEGGQRVYWRRKGLNMIKIYYMEFSENQQKYYFEN